MGCLDNISAYKANVGINYQHSHVNGNLQARWRGRTKAPSSNLYFQPKTDASFQAVGYDYVTDPSPDGFMDGHFVVDLTLTARDLLGDEAALEPQLIVRNLLGEEYAGIGRQSGSGVRPGRRVAADGAEPLRVRSCLPPAPWTRTVCRGALPTEQVATSSFCMD